ncbi:contactin-like isoform X2 [Lineus longissimus]|uniref:contactin-like isoform X2 n=1 Tax=Lineus longissimus TaxID=88925 RepID=UPI002B4D1DB3
MKVLVVLTAFVVLVSTNTNLLVEGQTNPNLILAGNQCPNLWATGDQTCYRFFQDVKRTWAMSKKYCEDIGAALVSINTEKKHQEVTTWLGANDGQNLAWYTSGRRDTAETTSPVFYWETLKPRAAVKTFFFWTDPKNKDKPEPDTIITYVTSGNTRGWDLTDPAQAKAFICESPRSEVQKLTADDRDFTYGQSDIGNIEKGPHFIQEPPRSVIFASSEANKRVSFECIAEANPLATYRWVKEEAKVGKTFEITASKKYTLSNGKLTIHNPQRTKKVDASDPDAVTDTDVGIYQCAATNAFGTILSNRVNFDFGYINDFSKTKRDPIQARLNFDTAIPCNAPPYFPTIRYKWYKDDPLNYIRTDQKPYMFISQNGKLYFSRVKNDDAGNYFCIASVPLPGFQDGKTSMPIGLLIGTGGDERAPQIHTDFPAIYPGNPKKGDNVTIECFALGTGDLQYSWGRANNQPMTKRVSFMDNNRILSINKIELEDGGDYTCRVSATGGLGGTGSDSKTVKLDVQSIPFFTKPLKNHHVDVGAKFTLHCEADGKPEVKYKWYKNGVLFDNSTLDTEDMARITFDGTRVTFQAASAERDNGMYQCAASNQRGVSYSTAQVRVLSFAPSFAKRPMSPITYAAMDGKATLICNPESAPEAVKTWYKDGQRMSVSGELAARIHVLRNGNLELTKIVAEDQGSYMCMAENSLGKASNTGSLLVLSKSVITVKPLSQIVRQNESVQLTCEAYVDPSLDFTYVWELNGFPIDLDFNEDWRLKQYRNLDRYKRGTGAAWGDLFIHNITYKEAGIYKCIALTPQDEATAEANVTVIGVPGEPAGLVGIEGSLTSSSIQLTWSAGTNHGALLTSYTVEAHSNLNPKWHVVKTNICPWYGDPTSLTKGECREMTPLEKEESRPELLQEKDRLKTTVTGLLAYNSYMFRVIAYNTYGSGDPSHPSSIYTTRPDKPFVIPRNLGGGGGKVGTLTITWDPLPVNEHNGPGLMYRVFFRRADISNQDKDTKVEVKHPTAMYTETIGALNFYLPYNVRIQAFNDMGNGPISEWVQIYSAEGMPVATPMNVRARGYNSSALEVLWDMVPDTREGVKGRVMGYRINYWKKDIENEMDDYIRQTILNQTDRGKIIGLRPNQYYELNVMVFNNAGNGPKSAMRYERTWRNAPQDPPRNVKVKYLTDKSISVHWRGVSISNKEEPLEGYIVRYWPAGESMVNAIDHYAGKVVDSVLTNLEPAPTRYYLRVLGYSRGGFGKMSSPILQLQIGPGPYLYVNPKPGSAGHLQPCLLLISFSILALFKYLL